MSNAAATYAPGSLVHARGREWVVLPDSEPDLLVLRPLGGGIDDTTAVLPALESVTQSSFPPPSTDDLGDMAAALACIALYGLLLTATRLVTGLEFPADNDSMLRLVVVRDLMGREVHSTRYHGVLDLSRLAPGGYLVELPELQRRVRVVKH